MSELRKKIGDKSAYAFVAPAVILMAVFIVYPLISSVRLSLTDWSGLGKIKYIGFGNYSDIINNPVFWNSILLQVLWAALSVVVLAVSGLFLALIVEYFTPFKSLIPVSRTILFMPMMMSLVSIGLLWAMIFNPMIGILNELLRTLNIIDTSQTIDLLGMNTTALLAAFIPCIWQWSGFGMVVFSAAMQGIPREMIEASVVDGCTKFGQIRHIVFPLLKPTIAIVCTVNLIGGLKCFDLIYVMTAGGPGVSTQVTSIYIFKQAFVNSYYANASAMSVILFIVTAALGAVFFKFSNKLDSYI
jgi:raffinose/stachyose/melibiose transport system permease protein